jgi:hypothetical protein
VARFDGHGFRRVVAKMLLEKQRFPAQLGPSSVYRYHSGSYKGKNWLLPAY